MASMSCKPTSIGNLLKAVVEEGISLAIVRALACRGNAILGRNLVRFRMSLRDEGMTVAEVDSYRAVA
jgi:hypothetical protein